jgi:hypothetical protein
VHLGQARHSSRRLLDDAPRRVSNELTYILAWESLADRERKWTAFQEDPAWHKVRDESERDGPIVATINSQILTPTAFSELK